MTAFYATDRRIVPFEGRSRQTVPQLLVSVRNGDEARLALAGGCDILDVKEPSRGSLGMADAAQIEDVLHAARGGPTAVPVSIALGDAVDWINPRRPSLSDELAHGAGQTFLKLGTAGLADEPDWPDRWGAARRRLTDDAGPRWIMVGYADAQPAKSPAIEEIVSAAAGSGCAGVLIDTFSKSGGGLFHWLSPDRLSVVAYLARRRGLVFAIAGRLQRSDLANVAAVGADIVGIRSAACRAGERTGPLCRDAVRAFRTSLADLWE